MPMIARIVLCSCVVTALIIGTAQADEKKPAPAADAKPAPAAKPAKAKQAEAKQTKPAETKKAKPAEAKKPAEPKKTEAKSKPAPKPKPAEPKTHTVKKERFKIDLTLKGVLQAVNERGFTLRPKVWQVWRVVKAVAPGTRVKKGDPIIQFDSRAIDEAIKDIEANQAYADLAYQAAQQELNFLEETVPLDLAVAERSKKYFDEDFKYYFEKQLPLARQIAEKNYERYKDILAYEMEELRQLEKMYKADDLTEETEEIILKRQRDTVKRLEFNLEQAKMLRDETIKKSLPREEVRTKDNAKIAELRLRSARLNFPRMLAQKRLEVQKLTRDREKARQQLKKMKEDRAMMALRSPMDGVIYYGGHSRGTFTTSATVAPLLKPNVVVKPGTTLMTIVAPRPVVLRTTVSESAIRFAKKGISGLATPVAYPDMFIKAKLAGVGSVPLTPGKFDAMVALDAGAGTESLLPGMNASAKLTAYDKKDAITLPPATVHRDENDPRKYHVYVYTGNGKHRVQQVSVGHRTSTKVEITRGLKAGDKVLLEKPKK